MPPPDKEAMEENKTIIQSYINTLNQHNDATAVITVNGGGDEEGDSGVTYFVDEEGRYYYQPTDDSHNLVSLPSVVSEQNQTVAVPGTEMIVDNKSFQTITLMPSETSNGEVSYVLVVQEENKPVVSLDLEMDQEQEEEKEQDDIYDFDDEEDEDGEATDDDKLVPAAKKSSKKDTSKKRNKYLNTRFTCNFCSYASPRRYLLLRHMKSHTEDRPFQCKFCERGFKTLPSLQNHLNMHNGVKPHICKYCSSPFTTSGELVRHVRYKHTHEKPHKCTECDYASVELSKLRRHIRCHTGERPYQCPHCTYASPDTFKLKRHLRTHTGEKPYKCNHCNRCFTQSNSLKAHKLIHNLSERPVYKCELCPAKCGRKTDLRIHVQKLHTSTKPLKCKRCGKTFPDPYSCKMHNKTHEGEKCFKCELCPYASTTLRHLKSHMLKHTDEKPFDCDQCSQSFRQKQLLRRHQNFYHNPGYVPKPPKEKTHSCTQCNKLFAHKGNLIRHLAIHDPDSGHHEKSLALKIGRQTKIQYTTQERVTAESGDSENEKAEDIVKVGMTENELKRGELVTLADGDGQQYVVLEVIQLEDGTEEHVAVVAPDAYMDEQDEEEEEDEEETETKEVVSHEHVKQQKQIDRTIKLEKDVDSCFGFDEDEEPEEEKIDFHSKVGMHLI